MQYRTYNSIFGSSFPLPQCLILNINCFIKQRTPGIQIKKINSAIASISTGIINQHKQGFPSKTGAKHFFLMMTGCGSSGTIFPFLLFSVIIMNESEKRQFDKIMRSS